MAPPVIRPEEMALVTATGPVVGSVINLVVWRLPSGLPLLTRPTFPGCRHPIRWRDSIPICSWLALRGRCPRCGASIPVRQPLVEAGTAGTFALAAAFSGKVWVLPALLYLAAIAIALALIDADTKRLPNSLVLRSYPVVAALLALASAHPGEQPDWAALGRAIAGSVALLLVYGTIWALAPSATGLGDVKLAGLLGLYLGWFGWWQLLLGWSAAYVLSGVFALTLLASRRATRKANIAFGPWMLLGAVLGIAAGGVMW
jgi:leader peptidase (prepilin peptidase)/N-methyltransferase